MKAGDLVRTKNSRVDTPAGSMGVIVEVFRPRERSPDVHPGYFIYNIQLIGKPSRTVRRLSRDIEVVAAHA